jgi:hypothetical protein
LTKPLSFKRHRFPANVVTHAVWLYFRFALSFREVGELLAQRGIDASYDRPVLDDQVRATDSQASEAASASAIAAVAPG